MATPRFTLGGANGWPIKEGSVLAYENTNGLFKPAPFDVARNSGGSYVDANGLIQQEYRPNVPRITYSGGRACLMNEEARTNVLTYSEEFDNTDWAKDALSVASNQATGPDGNVSMDEIIEDSGNSLHYLRQFKTLSTSTSYAFSCFFKKKAGGRDYAYLLINEPGFADRGVAVIDLTNGSVTTFENGDFGTTTATVKNFGNGIYKLEAIITTGALQGGTSCVCRVGITNNNSNPTAYTGDGSSSIYAWGAQLEEASYASSYIKTEGAAATRAAESIEGLNLGNFLGDSEGGLYVDFAPFDANGEGFGISLSDGTTSNRAFVGKSTGSTDKFGIVTSGGVSQASISGGAYSDNTFTKCLISYESNNVIFSSDGSTIGTDTSATMPSGLVRAAFDNAGSISTVAIMRGLIYELSVYDVSQTEAECNALTTL